MADENITSNQLQEKQNDQQPKQPVYNPFLGVTPKDFFKMLEGDNPDAPLVEVDLSGNVRLHPENVGKSGPRKININQYGQYAGVQKSQEELLHDLQEEQAVVQDIYGAIAPQFSKGYSKNALPIQIIHAQGDMLDYAGKAAGSTVMNVAHGILAQQRNAEEGIWKAYLAKVDNSDGSIEVAESLVASVEEKGISFRNVNVNHMQASEKVKDILRNYQTLLNARHEDEQRMRIAAFYQEEEGPISRWQQTSDLIPDSLKELKGNKNSIVGMAAQLGGEVAGSLAVYYTFGVLTGGSTALIGRMLGGASKMGNAMLAASTAVGEYSVFVPSFLNQYNSVRSQALINGVDIDTANAAGFIAGMFEGSLEMTGFKMFNRLYTKGGYLYNAILKGMLPEALQEGLQTFAEDIITNAFGITSKDFGDIMQDVGIAMLGGALGGGAMMSGRYKLEGITAASLKIVDNFNRTVNKHTAADVAAGVAQAKVKIQAENAPGVPPKDPPAGGAAAAVKETPKEETVQTLAAKVEGNQKTRLDEIREEEKAAGYQGVTTLSEAEEANLAQLPAKEQPALTGKEKTETDFRQMYAEMQEQAEATADNAVEQKKSEEVQNQAEATEEGTKAVADAVYEMYNEMKRIATDKIRLKYGKKVKDEQIKRFWNAVSEQVFLQAQGNEVAKAFEGQIDRAFALIDSQNETVKKNAKATKKKLLKAGFTEKQAQDLTSPDWAVRHKAQWDLAEDEIVAMFQRNGASVAEGKTAAKFIKGLLFTTTFLNPQMKVSDVIAGMDSNLFNMQRAVLHGQALPEMFESPLAFIKNTRAQYKSAYGMRKKSDALVHNILAGDAIAKAYTKSELYSTSVDNESLDQTKEALLSQASFQHDIINNMQLSSKESLSQDDWLALTLMRFMGASQEDINEAYGFTYNGESGTSQQNYEEVAESLFPSLTDNQMTSLINISQGTAQEGYTKEAFAKLNTALGFYEGIEGVATSRTNRPGVLLHETGHMSLSGGIIGGLELERLGLLPKTNGVSVILNHVAKKMQRDGVRVTEESLQETVLDALAQIIVKGQTNDNELNGMFTRLKEEGFKRQKQLAGSLLHDRASNQRRGGNLSKEQKEGVLETVQNIVENVNAANQFTRADEFQQWAAFEINNVGSDNAMTAKSNAEERLRVLNEGINMFVDSAILPAPESVKFLANRLYQAKDLLGLSQLAFNVAVQAKNVSMDIMIDEAAKANNNLDETLIEDTGAPIMFMAGNNSKPKYKQDFNPDFKPKFREQPESLAKEAKESFSYLDIWEGTKGVLSHFLQSIENAAPNNMVRSMLMNQFYLFSKRSQSAAEDISKVAKPLDEMLKKLKATDQAKYDAVRRDFQVLFWAPLIDGKKGSYRRSIEFVDQYLGRDAAKSWARVLLRIKELQGTSDAPGLLEQAGLPASVIIHGRNYFPSQVQDYEKLTTEWFGHAKAFTEIEKLKNRIRKQYDYDKLSAEEKAALDVQITDKINALFQRQTSDEDALSSFRHRQLIGISDNPEILNYYADPFDTVSKYLDAAYRTIMMRNLVGKTTYDENGNPNVDFNSAPGMLGRYLKNMPVGAEGNKAINNFREKLAYLAKRDSKGNYLLDSIRKLNQITTLGSVFNALNQTMDLAFAAEMFGLKNTVDAIKDVLGKDGIKLADVSALPSNEVLRMQGEGVLSKIGRKVFKTTGFEWTDVKVKEVFLNAATRYFQEGLNKDPNSQQYKDAMYYIDQAFPDSSLMYFDEGVSEKRQELEKKVQEDTRSNVIEALKKGDDNDLTRFIKWFMLTKTQPINAATVPALYNAVGPGGKLLYQFGTVAIRQLEFLNDRIQMRLATGGKKAAAMEFAKLAMFLAMLGLPKELLENVMKGRSTNALKTVALSPLHIFMINEYTIAVAQRDGIASAVAEITSPSFGLADNVSRDLFRAVTFKSYKGNTFKSIPIFGQFAYWWLLGGREQNVKNKTALFDFSTEDQEQESRKIASDLKYLSGEDDNV